jgi:hydroxymethylglutaryl-CoA synthase
MRHLSIGIHDLAFATGSYVMDLAELAGARGVDVAKYYRGIGQRAQTVLAVDEDIVTMAASAAKQVIDRHGGGRVRTVILATESGIDQSKSAAIYVHHLLELPTACRALELKQACYGGTSALQLAVALVARDPDHQVLVIAADVARYDIDSPGEATQGAAAVAMLVGAEPAIAEIGDTSGLYTADIMDFWRPNYRDTPVVDGRASMSAYLHAVEHAWKDYEAGGGRPVSSFAAFCYHQPFTTMAYKAHARLLELNGHEPTPERLDEDLECSTRYNQVVGNSYTASLYVALLSLLDNGRDLSGQSIALFSYGSGSVAELFDMTIVAGYHHHLRRETNQSAITGRSMIDYRTYRELRQQQPPVDGRDLLLPNHTRGSYRLHGYSRHQRLYTAIGGSR